MKTSLRVGVMGAGAIGCYVGGRLAARGCDVVLVGRDRLKADIDASGLTVEGLDGANTLTAPRERYTFTTDPATLAACDIVLVCVKSGQTQEAAVALAPVLPASVIVISLQNGVHNADVLREALPRGEQVRAGIFGFNVVAKKNGVFRQATTAPVVIEELAKDLRVDELAEHLRASDMPVVLTGDIAPQQWTKLLINLNNAVSALSDRPTSELVFGSYRKILGALISEALRVLRRAGIATAKMGPLPMAAFPILLRLPGPLLRRLLAKQLKVDPEARSSMWQDLAHGRKTEVDYLNGEIVKLAEKHGMSAPLNKRVVELVHAIEETGKGTPKLSADALWTALTR